MLLPSLSDKVQVNLIRISTRESFESNKSLSTAYWLEFVMSAAFQSFADFNE